MTLLKDDEQTIMGGATLPCTKDHCYGDLQCQRGKRRMGDTRWQSVGEGWLEETASGGGRWEILAGQHSSYCEEGQRDNVWRHFCRNDHAAFLLGLCND